MTAKLIIVMVHLPLHPSPQVKILTFSCSAPQGVSGSGKSTLAKNIADRLGFPFIDGDDYHPRSNVEKMSRGEALDDQDRFPWLSHLREVGISKLEEEARRRSDQNEDEGAADAEKGVGLVLGCSSLKGSYRQILRGVLKVERTSSVVHPEEVAYRLQEVDKETSPGSPLPQTCFVWIKGDKETLRDRLEKRQNHFFKAEMLDSQFEALEPPEGEPGVVVVPLGPSTQEQTEIALEGLMASNDSRTAP